ncbi:MAG: TonB-dependent receptor [Bacteroidales bacterium]|jgi:hypothetical protein
MDLIKTGFYGLLMCVCVTVNAQQTATIQGTVRDEKGSPLFSASVGIENRNIGTVTGEKGYFELTVPANEELVFIVYFLGFETYRETLQPGSGEIVQRDIRLKQELKELEDVEVFGIRERENTLIPIDIKSLDQLPNPSGNLESILKTLPGVASGSELSSQYSVRGGSYDENLIYVNDIEIYRPLLVQSAQQEGLSFVNPSMISSIQFSAGGFDAEYGDKLSSVLDIQYRKPVELGGSVSVSLLGGSVHLEGNSKNRKFTHNTGVRYKTTEYVLSTLDTKGDYKPSFTDLQSFLTYDLSKTLELGLLVNYSTNKFKRVPQNRSTDFGSFQQGFNFTVFYEGQELDKFETWLGALSLNYKPSDKLSMKFIASAFRSNEEITYDILKQYLINLATQGSSGRQDSLINIGIGTTLDHARNKLEATIYSFDWKNSYFSDAGVTKWGLKLQQEIIDDQIKEWQMVDSAGHSLPVNDEYVELNYVYKSENSLNNTRVSGYLQHTFDLSGKRSAVFLTLGARSQYWTYNKEITVSPRANLTLTPDRTPNLTWHLASGLYYQPPFYKEFRDQYGNLYPETRAQRALHLVAGTDYKFQAWDRPFVFTTEIYYKHLTRLVPYKLDDVRLQYLPEFKAKGYATGIDFKVYGEFVPGSESWFSLSLLSTKEDIYNDYVVNTDRTVTYSGYYSRPTDQWINFSLFFQDYLPSNPNYKVHLLLIYGSGLPYSGPLYSRPADVYKLGPYRRIDIGFSRAIIRNPKKNYGIESIWISLEILNLLDAQNTVSYDWIRTVESDIGLDAYFAVPNYLTRRSFNLKFSASF